MAKYSNSTTNRLRRIEGQIRGIVQMVNESDDCGQVITQLTAIRNATDKALAHIIVENVSECVPHELGGEKISYTAAKEFIDMLIKEQRQ